jgi:hypothetical protein
MFSWLWGSSNNNESNKAEEQVPISNNTTEPGEISKNIPVNKNPFYRKIVELEYLKNYRRERIEEINRLPQIALKEIDKIPSKNIDKIISHIPNRVNIKLISDMASNNGHEYLYDHLNIVNRHESLKKDMEVLKAPENSSIEKKNKGDFTEVSSIIERKAQKVQNKGYFKYQESVGKYKAKLEDEAISKLKEQRNKELDKRRSSIDKDSNQKLQDLYKKRTQSLDNTPVQPKIDEKPIPQTTVQPKINKLDASKYTSKLHDYYGNLGNAVHKKVNEPRLKLKEWRDKRSEEVRNELEGIASLEKVSNRPKKTMNYLDNRLKFSLSMQGEIANSSDSRKIEEILLEGKEKKNHNFVTKLKNESNKNDLLQDSYQLN